MICLNDRAGNLGFSPIDWVMRAELSESHLSETTIKRFWAKVDRKGPDECWPWTASRRATGYGQMSSGTKGGSPLKAHRVAFYLAYGHWPKVVMHTCDNPPCCNPAHLAGGDQKANMADMHAKGRHAHGEALSAAIRSSDRPRGERHYLSKLTDRQRAEIVARFDTGERKSDLAREYGVTAGCIHHVIKNRHETWMLSAFVEGM